MRNPATRNRQRRGFTLIELLTVIAVILILAGIMIPAIGGVLEGSRKASSRTQFQQYVIAINNYRNTYGFWPPFLADGTATDVSGAATSGDAQDFIRALTGRDLNGDVLSNTAADQNRRRKRFHTFGNDILNDQLIDNGLGLSDTGAIYIAVDHDNDGLIDDSEINTNVPNLDPLTADLRASVAVWSIRSSDGALWAATFDIE